MRLLYAPFYLLLSNRYGKITVDTCSMFSLRIGGVLERYNLQLSYTSVDQSGRAVQIGSG